MAVNSGHYPERLTRDGAIRQYAHWDECEQLLVKLSSAKHQLAVPVGLRHIQSFRAVRRGYRAGAGATAALARSRSRPIHNTSAQPTAVSTQSGNSATGKLPLCSRSTPISEVMAPVPRCASVLMAAIPAAAWAGESVSVTSAKNGPLIE